LQRQKERDAETPRSNRNDYGAATAARGVPAVEGLRMVRRPLTTASHARATIGEMNRE
jgi:hypothetical protein